MAVGDNGGHGPPIVPPTVCKKEKLRGRERERALVLLHGEMESTVLDKKLSKKFVVRTF